MVCVREFVYCLLGSRVFCVLVFLYFCSHIFALLCTYVIVILCFCVLVFFLFFRIWVLGGYQMRGGCVGGFSVHDSVASSVSEHSCRAGSGGYECGTSSREYTK